MDSSIVFDLDGTLITCENKQKFALYSILNRTRSINSSLIDDWWRLKRDGLNTEKALNQIGIHSAHLISKEWVRIIEDFTWCSIDKSYNDSLAVLRFLKSNNYFKIIILTARKSKVQPFQTVQRLGFTNYIDDIVVVSPENAIQEKAFFLRKFNPTMFIGDTESDYKASVISKIKFVALTRGQRSFAFLKNYGITQIENNLEFLYK